MQEFIAKFGQKISEVLKGWDRLVSRGELRARSRGANDRYLNALAGVDESAVAGFNGGTGKAGEVEKGRVRGLRLLGEDAELLRVVGAGEFCLNGFRNRDVRKPRMLRAHGIIQKLAKTRRYRLSPCGRHLINALGICESHTG